MNEEASGLLILTNPFPFEEKMKNPFLPVALFRTAEDEKKIEAARREDREGRATTDAGFSYGWFSQRTADSQGYYEEWANIDGSTIAVTHTHPQLLTTPPVPDAKYTGVVVTLQRRVNAKGDPVSAEPIHILVNGRRYKAARGSVQSLSEVAQQYTSSNADFRVRVEEDGRTIADGPLQATTNLTLNAAKNYTIVFELIEKPVEKVVEKPVYIERPVQVIKEVFREAPVPLTPPAPKPSFFPDAIPTSSSISAVDQAMAGKMRNSNWGPVMDHEGNSYDDRQRLLRALPGLYRTNRETQDFRRHTITASTNPNIRKRAERMGIGAEIIVMGKDKVWVPFSSQSDWRESIGTDLPNITSV